MGATFAVTHYCYHSGIRDTVEPTFRESIKFPQRVLEKSEILSVLNFKFLKIKMLHLPPGSSWSISELHNPIAEGVYQDG